MKRLLVTGATGFIGRHAMGPLIEQGYEVHAVSSRPLPRERGSVQWYHADLLDGRARSRMLDEVRPTHLLHFAWFVQPGAFWRSPENVRWTAGSLELVREFAAAGGQRAVLAGTCAEYEWGDEVLRHGHTPLAPSTLYGACKGALRSVLEAFGPEAGISVAWGRVFFLYGPHEAPGRLVSSVTRSVIRGEPAHCSRGDQRRDFLHVQDVADAFVALLASDAEGAYDIASGEPVPVRTVVETIGRVLGRPELIRLGGLPDREGEPDVVGGDPARLTAATGWRPRVDLTSGLRRTAEWWSTNTE